MNIKDFDEWNSKDFYECVLLDNKNKNTVNIQPKEISIGPFYADSTTEIEIRGILRDYDWKPERKMAWSEIEVTGAAGIVKNPYMFWKMPKIKDVIFNDPATIVFWADGTKTVVKCQDDDIFDPEKGLAMAITKKALGNKGNYCNELKKWLPKDEEVTMASVLNTSLRSIGETINKSVKRMNKAAQVIRERSE